MSCEKQKQIPCKARNDGAPDPRHHPLMAELDRMYRAYNDGLPLPNPGRVAKRLGEFLKANPKWPLEKLRQAVWNRYGSLSANVAEDPAVWLKKLANYAAGPLDKFGLPNQEQAQYLKSYWKEHE